MEDGLLGRTIYCLLSVEVTVCLLPTYLAYPDRYLDRHDEYHPSIHPSSYLSIPSAVYICAYMCVEKWGVYLMESI